MNINEYTWHIFASGYKWVFGQYFHCSCTNYKGYLSQYHTGNAIYYVEVVYISSSELRIQPISRGVSNMARAILSIYTITRVGY